MEEPFAVRILEFDQLCVVIEFVARRGDSKQGCVLHAEKWNDHLFTKRQAIVGHE
jgi:hypothetical protein